MGSRKSSGYVEITEDQFANHSCRGTISRSRTPLSVEQIIVQGKIQDLMKKIDHSKLDGRSQSGFTMLHHAAKENKPDIIEFLVNSGCDINLGDDKEQTPLHKAAIFGGVESIQLLLEKGVDIDKVDNNGHTPLHIAIISGGDIEVVKALLTKADVCIRKADGQNALHLAIRYHKVDCIEAILNHKQAPEVITATCNYGYTPLHLAVSLGHLDTVEKLLEDHKPDLFKITSQGESLLHLAAATIDSSILPFLLNLEGMVHLVNKTNQNLCTPLHNAAMNGHLKQVTLLMDRGAIFSSAHDGYSPLHYACQNGHLSVVKKLLERHSFQIHYVTKAEDTALHVAAKNGHAAIVKLLLDSGIPITHNLQQASFLDIALFNRDSKVASEAVKNDRWQECLDLISPIHPAPMIHLVHALPEVAKMVMDHSITSASLHPTHPSYWKKYNFKYLLDSPRSEPADKRKRPHGILQLIWYYICCIFTIADDHKANMFKVIKAMLEHDRRMLLTHPLLLTFVSLKWRNYGRLIIQIRASALVVLVILLTTLIAISDPPRPSSNHNFANDTFPMNNSNDEIGESNIRTQFHLLPYPQGHDHTVLAIPIMIVNLAYTVVVVIAFIIAIRMKNIYHWLLSLAELSTVVSTAFFIMTYPMPWLAAIVALLCAWFALNLFSRYFDVFGLYTIMFHHLLYSIVKAIFVCLYYIIGFGLIMYIIIGEETLYENPWMAVYTTFFTVIYKFDIRLLADKVNKGTLQHPTASYIIVLIMTVVLSVALLNLLIGISVGSIDTIQKNALLYQAKLKIHLFLELDPNIPNFWKNKIAPKDYMVKGSKADITTFVSNIWNYICSFFAPNVGGEVGKAEESNEDLARLEDLSYRIKQNESQIEMLIKHQKLLLSELKR